MSFYGIEFDCEYRVEIAKSWNDEFQNPIGEPIMTTSEEEAIEFCKQWLIDNGMEFDDVESYLYRAERVRAWSVELEANGYEDDTFTGTFGKCVEYCKANGYMIGVDCRLAYIRLSDCYCCLIIEEEF